MCRTAMFIKLENAVSETNLAAFPKYQGKVRDVYDIGARKLMVTTDRVSAFDRAITTIPFKGQVLNLISRFWFEATASIIRNHMIAVPYANAMLVKSLKMFPLEFIVRAYMTGSTKTSIWTLYKEGQRTFNGVTLPDGMKKNQPLPDLIITPTIKSNQHDEAITDQQILEQGILTDAQLLKIKEKLIEVFKFASGYAKSRGLILVDSKFELGLDERAQIVLGDELLTPDSSRYWRLDSYESKIRNNAEPDNYDKEILRLYLAEHFDPYAQDQMIEIPDKIRKSLSNTYVGLYEQLTGKDFEIDAVQLAS